MSHWSIFPTLGSWQDLEDLSNSELFSAGLLGVEDCNH